MAYIKINEILKKRGKKEAELITAAMGGARIKVLVGSCSHCAKLKDNVLLAARALDIPDSDIEIITDLARIVRMGVMTTPALIVDGRLVSVGKVLSVEGCIAFMEKPTEE